MTALDLTAFTRHPRFGPGVRPSESGQPLSELAAPGRLVELCGAARTTAAASILAGVQRAGETAAWIQIAGGELYPPDLAAAGVDLEALIVVHVPHRGRSPGGETAEQCRSAELLLRSGGFGLVILDFRQHEPRGSTAWQGRLLGQARQHEARVVIIRGPDQGPPSPGAAANGAASEEAAGASLGPLISLRIRSTIEGHDPAIRDGLPRRTRLSRLHHEVLKNKSGGPIEPQSEALRGPWGLA